MSSKFAKFNRFNKLSCHLKEIFVHILSLVNKSSHLSPSEIHLLSFTELR